VEQGSPRCAGRHKKALSQFDTDPNQITQPDTSLRVGVTPLHGNVKVITVPQLSQL
jgi:hypothetical protein